MATKPTDEEVGHAITDAALVSALTGLNSLLPRFVEALENVATKDEVAASRRTSLRKTVLIAVAAIVLVLSIVAADALYTRSTYRTIKGATGKTAQETQTLTFKCFLQELRYERQLDNQGITQLLLNDNRVSRGQPPIVVDLPKSPPDPDCAGVLGAIGVSSTQGTTSTTTTTPSKAGAVGEPGRPGPRGPRGAAGTSGSTPSASPSSPTTTRPTTTTTTRPSSSTCITTPVATVCRG